LQLAALAAAVLLLGGCMKKLPTGATDSTSGITIYEHANFRGASALLNRDVSSLSDYSGPCEHSSTSTYPGGGGTTTHNWSDCVSSLKVAPGWRATIYVDHEFKGGSFEVTADVPNLQLVPGSCDHDGMNDCISSIRVWQP
jgi:hypothetical protein